MKNKFKKILWYVKRPKYYGQFFLKIFRRLNTIIFKSNENIAIKWCQKNAVSTEEAIFQITGQTIKQPIKKLFPDIFLKAQKRAEACPVKMGGTSNIDLLYYLAEYLKAENVIETGVAYGWSALAILLSLSSRKNARLISTDMPYPGLDNSKYVGCVLPDDLKEQWKLIPEADTYALPKAIASFNHLDLCHYDSDKYYGGRMWAYPKLWELLRDGGMLISDDIENNLAFKKFSKSINREPIIIKLENSNKIYHFQYIGVLIK